MLSRTLWSPSPRTLIHLLLTASYTKVGAPSDIPQGLQEALMQDLGVVFPNRPLPRKFVDGLYATGPWQTHHNVVATVHRFAVWTQNGCRPRLGREVVGVRPNTLAPRSEPLEGFRQIGGTQIADLYPGYVMVFGCD